MGEEVGLGQHEDILRKVTDRLGGGEGVEKNGGNLRTSCSRRQAPRKAGGVSSQ